MNRQNFELIDFKSHFVDSTNISLRTSLEHFVNSLLLYISTKDEPVEPCRDSPCGVNALCEQRNDVGACRCIPEYYGDPYIECRPECVSNSECPSNRACINNKCVDPCPGTCGEIAICSVVNHSPICSCIEGYIGNPLVACYPQPGKMSILHIGIDPLKWYYIDIFDLCIDF